MSDSASTIADLRDGVPPHPIVTWSVFVRLAVIGVLVVLVYFPSISLMVHQWQTDGNWSHGWLVPVFSLYFLLVHRQELHDAPRRTNYLGLVILLGSLGLFYVALAGRLVYPQQFSLVPCLLGLVLLLGGWRILRVAWFPIAYLLFAIPLPSALYFGLTFPLRRIASVVAGAALRFLPEVYTQVKGVVVDYEYQGQTGSLNVEEACSGMRLMMAFCALGVAMAYLGERPLWHRVVMVLSCIPIAVFCNTIRVFVTGMVKVYGYDDWAQGSAHELLGLGMLPIALGLFAFVSYVLRNLFVEEHEEEVDDQ